MHTTALDRSVLEEALALRSDYFRSIATGAVVGLDDRCNGFFRRAWGALDNEQLSPATTTALRKTANLIHVVSGGLAALEEDRRATEAEVSAKARNELHGEAMLAMPAPSPSSLPDPSNPDDPAHYLPYRLWFLSNFSSPYPSPREKDSLLTLVPIHNKQQLDTWFTNNRRRSGWQALKREETDGSREGMEQLIRRVERGEEEGRVVERVRKVKAFFEDGGAKDRVSEGIAAIVGGVAGPAPATKTTAVTPRRIEKRATRGVSSSSSSSVFHPSSHEGRPAPYCRQTTPPRQRRQQQQPSCSQGDLVLSSTSSLSDQPYPRYPSTFSSPASSVRTVSSSSSSSLDSLVSYASAQSSYEPFPLPTPSSPPASSSLLSFAGPSSSTIRSSSSSSYELYPPPSTRRTSRPANPPPPQPQLLPSNPYFCTLADLPSSSSLLFGAGTTMGTTRR
ncbi:hypothetical protein JCM11251_007894 [Rhodosporidiobolus azoricus]